MPFRPYVLQGHTRPLSCVQYNREGDIVFTTAKDGKINAWFSDNGERLGTYDGHTGAAFCVDVNYNTTVVASGAADNTVRLWNASNGTAIFAIRTESGVRSVRFANGDKLLAAATDATFGNIPSIRIYDVGTSADQSSSIRCAFR